MNFKKKPGPYTNIFSFFGAASFCFADVIQEGRGRRKDAEEEERKREKG